MIVSTIKPKPNELLYRKLGLKEYYDNRNKILILRDTGGLGDILMHRMMFEDFHLLMPDCEIHFACPTIYHDAVKDHPYISKVLDSKTVKRQDYVISYNTTSACGRYESRKGIDSDLNRSDIWAGHCGVKLTKHNMHIKLAKQELEIADSYIKQHNPDNKEVIIICPISAMSSKNLDEQQLDGLIKNLSDYCIIGLHHAGIPYFEANNIPCISGVSIRIWMSILHQANWVISADSAAFHCRGGMQKPILGIYTWASGQMYGMYYNNKVIIQGPCPLYSNGCYNWNSCPVSKKFKKPCLTEITSEMILQGLSNVFINNGKVLCTNSNCGK